MVEITQNIAFQLAFFLIMISNKVPLCFFLLESSFPLNTQQYSMDMLQFGFPGGSEGKESACNVGDQVRSLGWEDSLEKEMATHSSILAWKIPWTEEPGRR